MKRNPNSLIAVIILATAGTMFAREWFVAPDGNDANTGTRRRPFATLDRAREAVLQAQPLKEAAIVYLRGGTYYLPQTLVFTPKDSGTQKAPVVYRGYKNENPVLSGGLRLELQWTAYRDGILQAQVPEALAKQAGFDQLFVNGERQRMARYPNFDPNAKYFGGTAADAISPARVQRWSNPVGAYVHGLHRHEWGDFHYRITGVEADGKPQLEGGWQNNRRMGLHEKHRFVENVFEELDSTGEWFFDAFERILYFMPPPDVDLAFARVEATRLESLVELRGTPEKPVRFVKMQGLTFTHTSRTFMKNKEPLLRSDWTTYRGGTVYLEGSEDCTVQDCSFDAVGGNAVFVNNYNRRFTLSGCKITEAGASGVCLVGDPNAVLSPSFEYGQFVPLEQMDRTPGPKSANYPAQCRVHDNLIHRTGQVEKQSAGVQIAMSEEITVSHNSIYDQPRAGINIGDGCWGGHVIEFNDVFDTVQETGDHGSFNSWGRDRYWLPDIKKVDRMVADIPGMPLWDARKPTILRNNRWRCDHGWDIDLDDGSTNYIIENNLCLNGGLKLREGFHRTVQNNIMVNNSFHPHVWYQNSGDVFQHNIVTTWYAPIGMPKVWGKKVDYNLLPNVAALDKSHKLGLDANSLAGEPRFENFSKGDYRVRLDSPALKIGFQNFPMNQFGVLKPSLRAQARTPRLPTPMKNAPAEKAKRDGKVHDWFDAKVKNISGMGEVSAAGLPSETGVLLLAVAPQGRAARTGFRARDVILKLDGQAVNTVSDLQRLHHSVPATKTVKVEIFRNQNIEPLEMTGSRR